jgi:predicted Fe-S protein YdhL (DUF1289 family)
VTVARDDNGDAGPRDDDDRPRRLTPNPNRRPADGSAVPSPCLSVCVMGAACRDGVRYCVGCARNLDEIATWSVLDDDEKRAVWAVIPTRLAMIDEDHPGARDLPPPTSFERR